ncbi:MAG: ATP-binding protein [Desulfocapsaceae bacterium]|nr:ATP-binding protein [Desulfocapsaceae bacterium]
MDIPRFTDENIAPERKKSRAGDGFQEFVAALLVREFEDLTLFPIGGKDGAIDHTIHFADGKGVVECKDIQGGYDHALKAWLAVADKLRRNITPVDGPPTGQGQYRPWYNTKSPINTYLFCTSSEIGNEGQHQNLEREIQEFFAEISCNCIHLCHLSTIQVEVLPWNRLQAKVQKNADLAFKWFPACRPTGLSPLKSSTDARLNFRSYLEHHQLPFYSVEMFVASGFLSQDNALPEVSHLFSHLTGEGGNGLIITGKGGIGKTRLVLEIGRHAEQEGWLVLQAGKRFEAASIDSLCQRITTTQPILILFDYVEAQKGFSESIDTINNYNEEYGYRIRYVANCRTNFYSTIRDMEGHREVNLSPGGINAGFFLTYREAIVRHILEHCGLDAPEEYIALCRDLPILAVFISFLRQNGRMAELAELRHEESFVPWLNKRLTASLSSLYPNNPDGMRRDLHRLLVQYPLSERGLELLGDQEEHLYSLHVGLANDGWVLVDDSDSWVSAHDIFVDQILGDFFQHSQSAQPEIKQALNLSRRLANIRSALISYQRISEELESLPWKDMITEQIDSHGEEWLQVRSILLTTPLLRPQQALELLDGRPEFWEGFECQISTQNALGFLARRQVRGELRLPSPLLDTLLVWLTKAATCPGRSNFFLNWALRLSPTKFQDVVRDWIQAQPRLFQSHYLMVAWLEAKLPAMEIVAAVKNWCSAFPSDSHLTFLAKAWLDNGASLQEARDQILAWLQAGNNCTVLEAQFVYSSWLNAGGGIEEIKEFILQWLQAGNNCTVLAVSFIYKSWLDAGGGIKEVQEFIRQWLQAGNNCTALEAQFVYKSWLDAGGGIEEVKDFILQCLQAGNNCTALEAQFVYKSWLDAGGGIEEVKEFIRQWLQSGNNCTALEAQFVYTSWLDAGGGIEEVKEFILKWLQACNNCTSLDARFVYKSWLDAGGGIEEVKEFIRQWLQYLDNAEQENVDFLLRSWMKAHGDFSLVQESACRWLTANKEKYDAVYITKYLARVRDLPVATAKDILSWCRSFCGNEDAISRLANLGLNLQHDAIMEEAMETWALVLPHVLHRTTLIEWLQNHVTNIFINLRYNPGLRRGQNTEKLVTLFALWVRDTRSFAQLRVYPNNTSQQTKAIFQMLVDGLAQGQLDGKRDKEGIRNFLVWINSWRPERKEKIKAAFNVLINTPELKELFYCIEFNS